MIRVVVFLVLTGLLALGVAWLADRPGEVTITWLGYRIDTSIMVMIAGVAAVAIAAIILWSIVRFLFRSPARVAGAMRDRQQRRGYDAISRGLIAIGAGDARAALRYAGQAERGLPGEPLALLLRAQSAQLHGDRAGAEDAFRAMASRADTRLLGLRGLYVEAQRRNDSAAARLFAEEAVKDSPALAWAGQAVLEYRCAAGEWDGALALLDANRKTGALDRAAHRRQRAVLLTAQALAAEEKDRESARLLAVEAARLAPDLVPASALAGRLLAEAGQGRKAAKTLETAWKANPHPDLADTYAHLRAGTSALDRLARVKALTSLAPSHLEGALAVARAALDAREFATARTALEPIAKEPTQRVAMLMAELEQLEHGDEGRAREWMSRAVNAARDPAWTADGIVSDRWLPVSPVTGRLDAFQWKVPVAELSGPDERRAVVIEAAPDDAAPLDLPARDLPEPDTLRKVSPTPLGAAAPVNGTAEGAAVTSPPRTAAASKPSPASRVPPIIPLTHAPDDPGPDPVTEGDVDLPPEPWQRIRQLFR